MALAELEIHENIATITFNNDAKRNVLSDTLLLETLAHFASCEQAEVQVVVLRANPNAPVWTAGHDLASVRPGTDPTTADSLLMRFLNRIRNFPAAVVAMVNASVWGGGCELIMACDLVIAADNACLAMTANKMGLPYDPGLLGRWLRHCSLHKIKQMFFTAQPLTAQEAYIAGIYNQVVSLRELERVVYELCERIAENSPEGIANVKYQLNALSRAPLLDADTFAALQASRSELLNSEAFRERLRALKSKLGITVS